MTKPRCQSPSCQGKQSFIVVNNNQQVIVCGNHVAWGIRSISVYGDEVAVSYVEPERIANDPTRRLDQGTPIGRICTGP